MTTSLCLQVSEGSQELLKDHYNFEYIGEKFVKGMRKLDIALILLCVEVTRLSILLVEC